MSVVDVTLDPSAATPSRVVALNVVTRVGQGAFCDRAFAGEALRVGLDPRARAFAQTLAYGVVQRRRTLDWLIDAAVDRAKAIEPAVRDILRVGAYELCYLDGVPERASVNEAVNAARVLAGPPKRQAARGGLVNAVLRRIGRDGRAGIDALGDGDPESAALKHSVPDALSQRLFDSLGPDDARAVLAAANAPAQSALRWNPLRGPRATLDALLPPGWTGDPLLPEAVVLSGAFAFEESVAWEKGLAMPQSRSSMLPARVLAPRRGERVLDLCAAPGAKATHLAALSANGSQITAVELHESRGRALTALARRLAARIEVVVGDARTVELEGSFDAVLVDAPCSGFGVLSAKPDARWRDRDIAELAALQAALLRRAIRVTRPGGRVVYSTCTLTAEENEDVIRDTGLAIDDLSDEYPGLEHPKLPRALLALPHRFGSDGFFVARMTVE